jgi:micrococcal nuclease
MSMTVLRLARLAALSGALLLHASAQALVFTGVVTHVTDGDSLWVRPATGGEAQQIRLQGIDAPEICQWYGREARAALAARTLHRPVVVTTRARDRYERTLARVRLGSQDLGEWLVARGYAWSDGRGGRGGPYAEQQAQASAARLGLWSGGRTMPPREFRRRHGSCH